MKSDTLPEIRGVRGPRDHAVRDQIVQAAHDYFAHYGFAKTTVVDLAREIGFSKAYIYRFFESKEAIGEAICADTTNRLFAQVEDAVAAGSSATDQLRRFSNEVFAAGAKLLFNEKKLHDIAAHAAIEDWVSAVIYRQKLLSLIERIVKEGRENGEFERKTALDETVRGVFYALQIYINPLFLERSLSQPPEVHGEVTRLILRSLAP